MRQGTTVAEPADTGIVAMAADVRIVVQNTAAAAAYHTKQQRCLVGIVRIVTADA